MKIEEGSSCWLLVDGRKEGARVFEGTQSVAGGMETKYVVDQGSSAMKEGNGQPCPGSQFQKI